MSPPPQLLPPGPPMVPCRLLCGVNSSWPVALPKCAGADRPPPKLGRPGGAAKFVLASAAPADVAAGWQLAAGHHRRAAPRRAR